MENGALDRKNLRIGLIALLAACSMLGLGFAAVPLYNIFCRTTGYGGTTQRATLDQALDAERQAKSAGGKTISIRFDANTDGDMPWTFYPKRVTDTIQIGQRDMALFEARNNSSVAITGTASFNVAPDQAGKYFNKIQCFCFTAQTLRPGQEVTMPVIYYVDAKALDDPNMKGVEQITLSYTFHRAK